MEPTKALSIKQPWAWLIVHGYKDIENRDWKIGRKPGIGGVFQDRNLELPSRIYIHAGKSSSEMNPEVTQFIANRLTPEQNTNLFHCINYLDYGAVIGEVDIIDCVTLSTSPWFVGKYGFILANPVAYKEPIPYRGQLGFFDVKL